MRSRRRRELAVVAAWLVYWVVFITGDYSTEGLDTWVFVLGPNLLLGLTTGRWRSVLIPFALVALIPLVPDKPCVDCGDFVIPVWFGMVVLAVYGSLAALAGVVCRLLIERRLSGRLS
jgi:hypothetical protein